MYNLKLDIEELLWKYVETEMAVQLFKNTIFSVSSKDLADHELMDCKQISEKDNPFAKLCFGLAEKQNITVELKVFDADQSNKKDILSCNPGPDYLYFLFHNRLLEQFDLSEISFMIMHEFGHYHFRTDFNPEKIITHKLYYLSSPTEIDFNRFKLIANLLSHISEYNADRYAAFSTKDLQGYKRAFLKLSDYVSQQHSNTLSIVDKSKKASMDWKNKFKSSHPQIVDRIAALDCLEKHIKNPNFDINQTPEVYNRMLELLSYDQFILEFGEYYEEKLKTQNAISDYESK